MPIEDVFSITGRGTVVTGRVERGVLKKMEEVEIVGITRHPQDHRDRRRDVPQAPGRGPGRRQRRGAAARHRQGRGRARPGPRQARARSPPTRSSRPRSTCLTKDEGGRHTPFFNGYRPQFYFRTTDVTGTVDLPEGVEMVMPGDNVEMEVELINPIAMEDGLRFAIREGGRTVGAGRVHQDHQVARETEGASTAMDKWPDEDQDQAPRLRPPDARRRRARDRRARPAHRSEGRRPGAAADRAQRVHA